MGALLFSVALTSAAVAAQPEDPRVLLVVTGAEAERAAFAASVQELLGRLHVLVEVRDEAPVTAEVDEPWIATVRADWSKPTIVTLDVVDRERQIHLIREFRRSGRPALVVEVAAHVTQSAIEEILHPATPHRPRVRQSTVEIAAEPDVTSKVEPDEPHTGIGMGVMAAFATRVQAGASTIAFGGAAMAQVDFHLPVIMRRGAVWAGVSYLAPIEISNDLVTLRVHTLAPRVGVALDVVRGERWKLNALVGGGADLFMSTPSSTALPSNRLSRFRVDPAPVATAGLSFQWGITSRLGIAAGVTVDLDIAPRRFVSNVDGVRSTVFGPWRVRPSLLISLSYELLGPAPFRRSAQ